MVAVNPPLLPEADQQVADSFHGLPISTADAYDYGAMGANMLGTPGTFIGAAFTNLGEHARAKTIINELLAGDAGFRQHIVANLQENGEAVDPLNLTVEDVYKAGESNPELQAQLDKFSDKASNKAGKFASTGLGSVAGYMVFKPLGFIAGLAGGFLGGNLGEEAHAAIADQTLITNTLELQLNLDKYLANGGKVDASIANGIVALKLPEERQSLVEEQFRLAIGDDELRLEDGLNAKLALELHKRNPQYSLGDTEEAKQKTIAMANAFDGIMASPATKKGLAEWTQSPTEETGAMLAAQVNAGKLPLTELVIDPLEKSMPKIALIDQQMRAEMQMAQQQQLAMIAAQNLRAQGVAAQPVVNPTGSGLPPQAIAENAPANYRG